MDMSKRHPTLQPSATDQHLQWAPMTATSLRVSNTTDTDTPAAPDGALRPAMLLDPTIRNLTRIIRNSVLTPQTTQATQANRAQSASTWGDTAPHRCGACQGEIPPGTLACSRPDTNCIESMWLLGQLKPDVAHLQSIRRPRVFDMVSDLALINDFELFASRIRAFAGCLEDPLCTAKAGAWIWTALADTPADTGAGGASLSSPPPASQAFQRAARRLVLTSRAIRTANFGTQQRVSVTLDSSKVARWV